jgi:DNA-binding response OmpR family regulator/tellurite resistance protein
MTRAKAQPRRHSSQSREPVTLRILFVERDITTADLLVPSLLRKGYTVGVVHNQRQALGQIRSLRPNLLVIDVASFGPRGYSVSDALRSRLAGVPSVLMLEEGHQAAGGAAEAFMVRPFTSRKLLHRIRVAAQHIRVREIQVGCLLLDLDGRVLYKGKQSWQLRPKEATVLALLMNNAGRVLSRQEIMKQVWETDYMGDTRTLSVHICWLRQKIEKDPRRPTLIMTLAKVLIAAAWADGELTHDEVNSMKDLLYRLPQLSAHQWATLEMYIETPIGAAERERLVADLQDAIQSPQDRELALKTLDEMMKADGEVSEEEQEIAAQVQAAIESVDVGMFSRLVKGMTGRRSAALADAPNREDYFEDYVKNRVYYGLRRRLDEGGVEFELGEDTLRTLSLAGGVMAQIARVNPQVTEAEETVIVDALQTHWHLTHEQSTFVAEVAVDETASHLDRYRLAREFADVCTYEERVNFLDVLFAVAAADGQASYDEIEEIRQISRTLKVPHQAFIDAKLKIPRDQRQQ